MNREKRSMIGEPCRKRASKAWLLTLRDSHAVLGLDDRGRALQFVAIAFGTDDVDQRVRLLGAGAPRARAADGT
jgi:hypothetical protein